MEVRAALAAADAGEGRDRVPVAVAVAGKKEAHVTFGAHLQLLLEKLMPSQFYLLMGLTENYEKEKFCSTY